MFVLFVHRPAFCLSDNALVPGHVAQGLSLQLVERPSEIPQYANLTPEWKQTCDDWIHWYKGDGPDQDSGLR